MNKTLNNVSKVFALVLALVMVLGMVVPALATGDVGQGTVDGKAFTINAQATLNGVLEDGVVVTVAKSEAGEQNWEDIETGTTDKDGLAKIELELEANKIYKVYTDAKNVDQNTTYEYYFSTDENGNLIKTDSAVVTPNKNIELVEVEDGKIKTLEFALLVEDKGNDMGLPLLSLDLDGQPQGGVEFKAYTVKTTDDKKYFLFSDDKTYIKDEEIGTKNTDEDGYYDLVLLEGSGTKVGEREIIVLERDGVVVTVVDLANDDKAILPAVPKTNKVTVTVLGDTNEVDADDEPAPKAVEGATVEIQKQITEVLREQEYAKEALASGKTDKNGRVVFEDVDISQLLKVLMPTNATDNKGEYTNINLLNRVAVTEAEGYVVPRYEEFTLENITEDEVEIEIILKPINNDFADRINGNDRYETSVEVAKEAFGDDAQSTVIIASGENFADSLVASSLVGALDMPLVLTSNSSLTKVTAEYLEDVKATNAIVVGNAIGDKVHSDLEEMGIVINTLGGANRYETAEAVLRYLEDVAKIDVKEVLVASGSNFADALVASVPSALNKQPILLTEKDSFASEANDLLKEYGITKVVVVGGEASVSAKAFAQINVATKERLASENRQLTSMKVAEAYFSEGGKAILVDGTNFPDAISAGQLAYKKNAPILFTESKTKLGTALEEFLVRNKMTDITIVGGPNSVYAGAEADLKELFLD